MARNKIIPVWTVYAGCDEDPAEHERFEGFRAATAEAAIQMAVCAWTQRYFEEGGDAVQAIRYEHNEFGHELRIRHDAEFDETIWFSAREGRHHD